MLLIGNGCDRLSAALRKSSHKKQSMQIITTLAAKHGSVCHFSLRSYVISVSRCDTVHVGAAFRPGLNPEKRTPPSKACQHPAKSYWLDKHCSPYENVAFSNVLKREIRFRLVCRSKNDIDPGEKQERTHVGQEGSLTDSQVLANPCQTLPHPTSHVEVNDGANGDDP